jgi:hypothetical protein
MNKGSHVYIYKGYVYHKVKKVYRCNKHQSNRCQGRIRYINGMMEIIMEGTTIPKSPSYLNSTK